MVEVNIVGSDLKVDITGWDIVWSLKRGLTVPLAHVIDATVEPVAGRPGWKVIGTGVPRGFSAGKFRSKGKNEFWVADQKEAALVINLRDEKYARFVLQVKDPQTAAEKINSVAGGGSRVAA